MRMPASIPNRCPSPTMKTRCHYTCRLGEENCPMYQQLPGIWRAHPSKCFPVTLVTQLSPAFVGRQPQLGGLCEHTVIHVEAQLLECRWEDRKKNPNMNQHNVPNTVFHRFIAGTAGCRSNQERSMRSASLSRASASVLKPKDNANTIFLDLNWYVNIHNG